MIQRKIQPDKKSTSNSEDDNADDTKSKSSNSADENDDDTKSSDADDTEKDTTTDKDDKEENLSMNDNPYDDPVDFDEVAASLHIESSHTHAAISVLVALALFALS